MESVTNDMEAHHLNEDQESTVDPGPSAVNCSKFGHDVKIDKETLCVRYSGKGQHPNDVGAVQSDLPVPSHVHTYYFEVEIVSKGSKGCITVGYSNKHFKPTRHVGWDQGSYGYHGFDGKKFNESTTGEEYGPEYTTGDVIGAGFCLESREIFFTKNGENLGIAFRDVHKQLFPTVGLHSEGEEVRFNFGATPYFFDIEDYVHDQKDARQQEIELVEVRVSDVHDIVGEYLEHYGFGNTLASYERATRANKDEEKTETSCVLSMEYRMSNETADVSLQQRTELRHLVMEGDMDKVLEILESKFPDCLEDEPNGVNFAVQCQRFLELVRGDHLEEAVTFAQEILGRLQRVNPGQEIALQKVLSSIAYTDVTMSPVSDMFEQCHREHVADIINRSLFSRSNMFEHNDGSASQEEGPPSAENSRKIPLKPKISVLESLLRQLVATKKAIREANEDQGEIFDLDCQLR